MPSTKEKKPEAKEQRVAFTARLTMAAYDAIFELQRKHRRKTGRHRPLWEFLDEAVRAYAKKQGIKVGK